MKKAITPRAVTFGKIRRSWLKTKAKGTKKLGNAILRDSIVVPTNLPPEILQAARQLMATGGDLSLIHI